MNGVHKANPFPSGGVQIAQVACAGEVGGEMVGPLGYDQAHVDAAAGGEGEGPGEHFIGNEIGRDDPDPVARLASTSASSDS